ncbi:MAG: SseB family protein [Lachnospiraceae bacterium]|nr:SseB family protein [Lachnospiraceae bacterium]
MTKDAFKKNIPGLEKIFIIYSRLTHLPYVECNEETFDDESFIYTEEEDAVAKAKALTEEKKATVALKVENKHMLQTLSGFFTYGINMLVFRTKEEEYRLELKELINRPDFSKIPNDKKPMGMDKPIENPQLQLSMMYFLQELRRGMEKPDKEAYRSMEEEVAVNLQRAQYLMPVQEAEKDGNKILQMMMIKLKDGTTMLPIFTDVLEYMHFNGKRETKLVLTDLEKMDKMTLPAETKGFLLNPAGAGLPLTKEYVVRLAGAKG